MENFKVLITEEQIAQRVGELAAQIMKDYPNNKEIVLIGVLTGAVYFTVDLSRKITNKIDLQFVKVKSYDKNKRADLPSFDYQLQHNIKGKDVIIVEDILDSGETIAYLLKNIKVHEPKSLKICVLLNKKIKKNHDIKCDYIGFDIEDKYVVGYGLDDCNYDRNIPYIGYKEVEEKPKQLKKEL